MATNDKQAASRPDAPETATEMLRRNVNVRAVQDDAADRCLIGELRLGRDADFSWRGLDGKLASARDEDLDSVTFTVVGSRGQEIESVVFGQEEDDLWERFKAADVASFLSRVRHGIGVENAVYAALAGEPPEELEAAYTKQLDAQGAALDKLVAECRQLISRASFADGVGTVLTMDVEAIEALVGRELREDVVGDRDEEDEAVPRRPVERG